MRRPRLTIRTTMVLIAVAAVLLAAEKARRRWRLCRDQILVYSQLQETYLGLTAAAEEYAAEKRRKCEMYQAEASPRSAALAAEIKKSWDQVAREAKHCRGVAEMAERMRGQYERAMFRPWESLPPEPPLIEW